MAKTAEEATTRTPLNRDRVLRAAIALADEGGIESLSMRKVAEELGVSAISAHEMMLRHAWASGLGMRQRPGGARLRYGNSLLGCFRNAGFSKDVTYHAYHIVESYILGYTFQVLNYRSVDMSQFADIADRFVRGEFADEYPHFTEHVRQHMEPDREDDVSAYELGLDLILGGLETLRDGAGGRD